MDAFERLLTREGVQGLGVNALVREAQVGKDLIYRYFGGLAGVAEAWARKTEVLPSAEELIGHDIESFQTSEPVERLRIIFRNYVRGIKKRRAALTVLAVDLLGRSELTQALENIHQKDRAEITKFFSEEGRQTGIDMEVLGGLLVGGINYLAMRSNVVKDPYNIPLDSDEGWDKVEETVLRLIDLAWEG
jgi:AcrR family transcriptional regulator